MPTEEEERDETPYERKKSQAAYWYNKASDLRGAAGAIWASMREPEFAAVPERLGLDRSFSFSVACGSSYLMLCGLALELLLKAIIIEKGVKLKKPTHTLPTLWKKAGLESTETQNGLLRILTEAIIWDGRYPTPLPKKEMNYYEIQELELKFLFTPLGEESDFREPNGALSWESFNQLLWAQALKAQLPDPTLNRGWGGWA
jgi:hypothetical protein